MKGEVDKMSGRKTRQTAGRLGVLAISIAATLLAIPASAHAADLSGRISADTTLTAGSVWRLTGDVEVASDVNLVVEPGARVEGGGHVLAVFGSLRAMGTTESPAVFRGVRVRGRGSFILPSTLETYTIEMHHADVDGGDLQGGDETSYGSWVLQDSTISNIDEPMYLWYPRADCFVERNVFVNAGNISCGLLFGDVFVRDNVFWRSAFSAPAHDAAVTNWTAVGHLMFVNGNSFLNPGMPTAALDLNNSSGAIDASGNWWGVPSASSTTIAAMVYDREDDLRLPSAIDTSGALDHPSTSAPSAELPVSVTVATGPSFIGSAPGAKVTVAARFTESIRQVPVRANVGLLSSADGVSWSRMATSTTGTDGNVSFGVSSGLVRHYRIAIQDAAGVFSEASSSDVVVAARPTVGAPKVPKTARRSRLFTVSGVVLPMQVAGSKTVVLSFYRLENRRWKLRATVPARNANYGAGSKYSARLKLSRAGTYRVRAKCTDPMVPSATSKYVRFAVR